MPRLLIWFSILLLAGSTLAAAPPATRRSKVPKIRDLTDTVNNTAILSKFAILLQASNLGTFLSSRGPFTLFVPTNSAFSKLPQGMFEDLQRPENQEQLQRIILFHIVNGKTWDAKDLLGQKSLPSCEGTPLPLKATRSGAEFVNKARLTHADIRCANGLLDQIDTLLLPPKLILASKPAEASSASAPSTNVAPATNAAPNTNAAPAGVTGSPGATPSDTNATPDTNAPASMQ